MQPISRIVLTIIVLAVAAANCTGDELLTAKNVMPTLVASYGGCIATFEVIDSQKLPVAQASVEVYLPRVGAAKNILLRVSTDDAGHARFVGLPRSKKEILFTIRKREKHTALRANTDEECAGTFVVELK